MIAGIAAGPSDVWMHQIRRNLTNCEDGWLIAKTDLIVSNGMDAPTRQRQLCACSELFRRLIDESGTKVVRLPHRSPNLNAYSECSVRSIKDERPNRLIFFGRATLRRAVAAYINHDHNEHNYQGLTNRLIRFPEPQSPIGTVLRRERLGGLLNCYYRKTA